MHPFDSAHKNPCAPLDVDEPFYGYQLFLNESMQMSFYLEINFLIMVISHLWSQRQRKDLLRRIHTFKP